MQQIKRVLTRRKLQEIFGTAAEVAKFYDTSVTAVYMWGDNDIDGLIPEKRELQIRAAAPELVSKYVEDNESFI